jgi:hypothetical protein
VPLAASKPARDMAAGEISVRSAPVSSSRRNATPFSEASTISGPPAYGTTTPAEAGAGIITGPGVGVSISRTAPRNAGGIEAGSVV